MITVTGSRISLLASLAMVAVPNIPAIAQSVPVRPDPAPPASIEQIHAEAAAAMDLPAQPSPVPSAVNQLTSPDESAQVAAQLTSERKPEPQVQVYKGRRTAETSDPLSRRSEGRVARMERVEGKDRCDPAERAEPHSAHCEKVIESRAAEFAREEPSPLSPEQRIMIAEQLRDRASTATAAAKLLAIGSLGASSAEAQEVASIVLKPPPEDPKPEKPKDEEPSDAEAAAAALVEAVINQNPR